MRFTQILSVLLAAACTLLLLRGCAGMGNSSGVGTGGSIGEPGAQPIPSTVRVRIAVGAATTKITSSGGLRVSTLGTGASSSNSLGTMPSASIRRSNGLWVINDRPISGLGANTLTFEPISGNSIQVDANPYPGNIQLVPTGDSRFDIVNRLPIDDYLPGVLDRELYDSWHIETYKAQAVAARSYAIENIINSGTGRHYDVESTVASQAYQGTSTNAKALAAVRETAGTVLTHNGNVLLAYYSSTCGGIPQTPSQVKGGSLTQDIPPLLGHAPHDYCAAATYYRWGPINRSVAELAARITAWARANPNEPGDTAKIAALGPLRDIRPVRSNAAGRPILFVLIGDNNSTATIRADSLRHAANQAAPGYPAPTDAKQIVRSGHFDIRRSGNTFIFENGRGFGHGMGLCQYGAEGMAKAGYHWRDILAHHYPDAQLERVY